VLIVMAESSSSPPQLLISLIVRFISGLSKSGGGFDATHIGGVRNSSSTLVLGSNLGGNGIRNMGLDLVFLMFSHIAIINLVLGRRSVICELALRVADDGSARKISQ
jgi:hypothetical protein